MTDRTETERAQLHAMFFPERSRLSRDQKIIGGFIALVLFVTLPFVFVTLQDVQIGSLESQIKHAKWRAELGL